MSGAHQRIVCLTTSAALGGAETSLLTLIRAVRRLEPGWDVSLIAPAEGALLEQCGQSGIAAAVLPYPPALRGFGETGVRSSARSSRLTSLGRGAGVALTLPRYVMALRRALRHATVVHSNGLKAHVTAALARSRRVRLVWHVHDYLQARPLSASLMRRLAHRADAIVANSDSVLADVAQVVGLDRPSCRIYNAVDLAAFGRAGARLNLASLAGLADDSRFVRIALVATFARWKGHEVFIDAVARLRARERVRAYIVGGPVYETAGSQWTIGELRQHVAARGMSETIGFTGHLDDVPAAMRSIDILVHASTAPEPFGMAVAEGMAAGRAVVAARAGGARELFTEGATALAHRPGDAAELAAKLDQLVADPGGRAALGARARLAAAERFDPVRMASEFRKVYLG